MPWVLSLLACSGPAPEPTDDSATPAGSVATLDALELTGVPQWPDFASDRDGYAVSADDLPVTVEVVAIPTDPEARVEVHRDTLDGVRVQDGSTLSPGVGEKVVVDVTSADGSDFRTYEVVVLPRDFPEVDLRSPGEQSAGWLMLATFQDQAGSGGLPRMLMMLDHAGVPRWYRETGLSAYDFRVHPTAHYGYVAVPGPGEPFTGILMDADFAEVARVLPMRRPDGTPVNTDVHELIELEDGSRIVLGTWNEPADLSPLGGPTDARILHHVVQEQRPDGTVAFEWTTVGAVDLSTVPVWVVEPATGIYEYAHVNSVSVADDGSWIISTRLNNQVLKVAREPMEVNGRSFAAGDVVWRLGGPGSDFEFVGDDRGEGMSGFFGQHSARPLPGDRILLYDNALYREALGGLDQDVEFVVPGDSRAVEYQLDVATGTATLVSEFALAGSGATSAAGSVQRLDDGHTLIGWGDLPQESAGQPVATEVDADGNVVMELHLSDAVWSYRVYRFELP